ncbi:hypothetical protein FPQ18DRAFT_39059 [Pyronema domesticum]|nr:hypothetical protein FPQ18DRAFT_39059 [Pyronema domesticum]
MNFLLATRRVGWLVGLCRCGSWSGVTRVVAPVVHDVGGGRASSLASSYPSLLPDISSCHANFKIIFATGSIKRYGSILYRGYQVFFNSRYCDSNLLASPFFHSSIQIPYPAHCRICVINTASVSICSQNLSF